MVKIQSLGTRNTRTESDSEYPFNVKYVLEISVQYCSKNTELFCMRHGNFICLYSDENQYFFQFNFTVYPPCEFVGS